MKETTLTLKDFNIKFYFFLKEMDDLLSIFKNYYTLMVP